MADKLIRYEALENVINVTTAAANLAQQKADLANTKAGLADTKAQLAADKAALADQTTTTLRSVATSTDAVRVSAQAAADKANTSANTADTNAREAKTQATYAQVQGDYAKRQGDYALAKANGVGNMLRSDYDTDGSGSPRSVENARRVGGLPSTAFVEAGSDINRIKAVNGPQASPGDLSSPVGHGRFRLAAYNPDGTGPQLDSIDLSTAGNANGGGVNALQFRKDSPRVYHRYAPWGAASWGYPQALAYLEEVVPRVGSSTIQGKLTVSDGVFWGESGTRTEQSSGFSSKMPSGAYVGTVTYATGTTPLRSIILNASDYATSVNSAFQLAAPPDMDSFYLRSYSDGKEKTAPWRSIWHSGNFSPSDYARAGDINKLGPLFGNRGNTSQVLLGDSFATLNAFEYFPAWNPGNGNTTKMLQIGDASGLLAVRFPGPTYIPQLITSSSRELKQDIERYEDDALRAIQDLDIVRFHYKASPELPRIGIIADDTENEDITGPSKSGMDMQNTIGILIRAVQQLSERVDKLSATL